MPLVINFLLLQLVFQLVFLHLLLDFCLKEESQFSHHFVFLCLDIPLLSLFVATLAAEESYDYNVDYYGCAIRNGESQSDVVEYLYHYQWTLFILDVFQHRIRNISEQVHLIQIDEIEHLVEYLQELLYSVEMRHPVHVQHEVEDLYHCQEENLDPLHGKAGEDERDENEEKAEEEHQRVLENHGVWKLVVFWIESWKFMVDGRSVSWYDSDASVEISSFVLKIFRMKNI